MRSWLDHWKKRSSSSPSHPAGRGRPWLEALEPREVPSAAAQRFVTEVYQGLFQRPPEPAGLAAWTGLLDGGTPHVTVVRRIAASPEYQSTLVQTLYRAYLSRPAEPAGLNGHLDLLRVFAPDVVQANILGSTEYFQKRGLNANDRFVNALFQDALGREASAVEIATHTTRLDGGASRGEVALEVLQGAEGRQYQVRSLYRRFLYRD